MHNDGIEPVVLRYLNGDLSVRNELIERHIGLAISKARAYNNWSWGDELEGHALLLLVEGVDRYRLKATDTNITAYISKYIKWRLFNHVCKLQKKFSGETFVEGGDGSEVLRARMEGIADKEVLRVEMREIIDLCARTEEERKVFRLKYAGYNQTEIGTFIGRSQGYVTKVMQKLQDRFNYYWNL